MLIERLFRRKTESCSPGDPGLLYLFDSRATRFYISRAAFALKFERNVGICEMTSEVQAAS
jgi:hypothetical protein